ncbi:MAG: hypothetical protein ACO3IB_13725, partial [Phycisphaerales bacterium]
FYQFLLDVESLPRITRINGAKITKLGFEKRPTRNDDEEPIPEGSMRAEFTLSIYFNGDPKLAAPGGMR